MRIIYQGNLNTHFIIRKESLYWQTPTSKISVVGFSAAERALILGHEVQTNENIYSVTDKRQLVDIRNRLIGNNSSNSQKSTKRIARKKGPVSE